jgi:hypothetical protein
MRSAFAFSFVFLFGLALLHAGLYLGYRACNGAATGIMKPRRGVIHRAKHPMIFWISVVAHALSGALLLLIGVAMIANLYRGVF